MGTLSIASDPGEAADLEFDHESLPYAGKFGRTQPGTAVYRDDGDLIGAISFSPDRADRTCCRIRYLSIVRSRHGEGHATALVDDFCTWALDDQFSLVKITVLNPYAVTSVTRAGFSYTGETGPAGGIVLERPADTVDLGAAMAALDPGHLIDEQRRYRRRVLEESGSG